MSKYLTELDEGKMIKEVILKHGDDYYLWELLNKESVRNEAVGFGHQFPAIHIIKTGGSEENVLGDVMAEGKGNFQPSTVLITVLTRRNNTRKYNNVEYKDIELCKKIRDVVKQVMFNHHSFYDNAFPDLEFVVQSMTSDSETGAIRNYGAIFTAELLYSITFEVKR